MKIWFQPVLRPKKRKVLYQLKKKKKSKVNKKWVPYKNAATIFCRQNYDLNSVLPTVFKNHSLGIRWPDGSFWMYSKS